MTNPYIQNPTAVSAASWTGVPAPHQNVGTTPTTPNAAPTNLVAVACVLVSLAVFVALIPLFNLLSFGAGEATSLVFLAASFASTAATHVAVGQAFIRSVWLSAFGALLAIVAIAVLIAGFPTQVAQDEVLLGLSLVIMTALALVASIIGLFGSREVRTSSKPGLFVWLALGTAMLAIVVKIVLNFVQSFAADMPPSAIGVNVAFMVSNAALVCFFVSLGIRHPAARGTALGLLAVLTLLHIGVEVFNLVGRLDAIDPLAQLSIVALALRVTLYLAAAVCIVVSFPGLMHWRRSVASQHR